MSMPFSWLQDLAKRVQSDSTEAGTLEQSCLEALLIDDNWTTRAKLHITLMYAQAVATNPARRRQARPFAEDVAEKAFTADEFLLAVEASCLTAICRPSLASFDRAEEKLQREIKRRKSARPPLTEAQTENIQLLLDKLAQARKQLEAGSEPAVIFL